MDWFNEDSGVKYKPVGFKHQFTTEQALEIMRCTADPIYFIKKYVYIEHPTRGPVKFDLFDYQKELINTYDGNKRVVALMSRQSGKTTTAGAYLLWWAIFKDNQTILVLSKDQDGANEIMERLWFAYEELPVWLKPGVKVNQVKTKKFENNSRIRALATTKTSGRGKSNSIVYLDEFAFVPPGIANDFWASLYPTLAAGGKCIMTSTPNTDEDKFAQIWLNADMSPKSEPWIDPMAPRQKHPLEYEQEEDYDILFETEESKMQFGLKEGIIELDNDETITGFVGFHAPWTRVPDDNSPTGYRGERFKKETILSGISEEEWLREFECGFITGDATLVSAIKLANLRKTVRKPRFVDKWGCRWYEEILANGIYAVTLDPSEGVGHDDACIQVWEIPYMVQVAEWNDNMADQTEQTKMLRRVLKRIYAIQQNDPDHDGGCDVYYSVERNTLGIGILQTIEYEDERTFPGFMIDSTPVSANVRGRHGLEKKIQAYRGLLTSPGSKYRYAIDFKNLIERNLFIPRSKHLISQLKTFVKKGQRGWTAKEGSKDDIVMYCVLMCHLVDEVRFHEPDLDDFIRPDVGGYDPDDLDHPDNQGMPPII